VATLIGREHTLLVKYNTCKIYRCQSLFVIAVIDFSL
jgi:hypothetical protein